ncbi:MAG: MFS transporter [Actinomycetes bacterium]
MTQTTPAISRSGHAVAPAMSGPVLAVLLSAMFMGQFDFFVVNVAAPSLRTDLHASDGALQLIVGGYAFAYAAGLVTGGRLGDLFGYRRLFVVGMASFAAASLACSLAATPSQLVAARLAQGLTAAAMLPQVLAVITATVPAPARPRAIGWYGVASGLGAIAGQVLGGALITANIAGLGWRTIFLVNVPVGAVAAILAWRMLPTPPRRQRPGLDPLGAIGAAATVGAVLVPLTLGRSEGWPTWTWACMAAAIPLAAATWRWQRHLTEAGATPLLDVSLLRTPTFRAGLAANAAFMCYFGSFMFTLTLLLQAGLGLDAFGAGLVFAPAGVTFSLGALAGRPLLARYGRRTVLAGSLLTAASLGLLAVSLHLTGTHTALAWITALAAAASLGNGIVLPSLIGAAMVDVAPERAGLAAGALNTAQQFASAIGVATIGALFFTAIHTPHGAGGYPVAMTWAATTDSALVLLVAALIQLSTRTAKTH